MKLELITTERTGRTITSLRAPPRQYEEQTIDTIHKTRAINMLRPRRRSARSRKTYHSRDLMTGSATNDEGPPGNIEEPSCQAPTQGTPDWIACQNPRGQEA